jgi:ribosomal protein S27AE
MADALSPGADLSKVYGEEMRCPTCGAFAKSLPHPDHHWVCGVCGAPRIEMHGEAVPEESLVALREASMAQRTAAMQRLVTWMTGLPAGLTLLLAVALAPASFIAAGVLIATGVALAILSTRASRRAATERKRLRGAVEHAYEATIWHLTTKDKTPSEIATLLRIAESDVEAALATQGDVRIAPMTRIAASVSAAETETVAETDAETEAGAEKRKA